LTKINNETKIRRSTKAVVLGKGEAKVISYKDIKEARVTRTAKDTIKSKGKRGRKRKNTALEADEPDAEAEAEPKITHATKEIITGKRKRGRKRKSAVPEAGEPEPELELEPEPEVAQTIESSVLWRVLLARMY
jgi:hypothetical protein